jgi:hypothetical protein
MKKTLPAILAGALIGAGAMWVFSSAKPAPAADAAKPAAADEAPPPGTVHLETDEQEKADLQMAKPTTMEFKPETTGYARVIDPASLVSELAEVEMDKAAFDASGKALARLQTLQASDNASAQALETADAAAKHDQSMLTSAQAKMFSEWGPALAGRDDLPQLAHSLLVREAALVRVDIPGGEKLPAEPLAFNLSPVMSEATPVAAELLGPAASADPQAQGSAFLVILRQNPPAPGTQMAAWITGADVGQKGLRLPGLAIVRYDSDTFIYAQTNSEDFERRRVKVGATLRNGDVFIPSGEVTAQDQVVVKGAAQLLSEELKAATGGP